MQAISNYFAHHEAMAAVIHLEKHCVWKSQATGGKTKQDILVTYNSVTSRLTVGGSEGSRLGHRVLCTA